MGAGCSSGNQVQIVRTPNDNFKQGKRHVSICGFAPQLTVVAEMHEAEMADFQVRRREYLRLNQQSRAIGGSPVENVQSPQLQGSVPVLVLPPSSNDPLAVPVTPEVKMSPPASPRGTRLHNPFQPSQLVFPSSSDDPLVPPVTPETKMSPPGSPTGTRLQNPFQPSQFVLAPSSGDPFVPPVTPEGKPYNPSLARRATRLVHGPLSPTSGGDGDEGAESFGPFEVVPMTSTECIELVGREYQCYTIATPPHLAALLTECVPMGRISKWCNVKSCDPLYHNNTLIPSSAVHYAFAYPLTGISQEVARMIDYADCYGAFLSIGGFMYVNAKFEVVAVFCLRPSFSAIGSSDILPSPASRKQHRTALLSFSPPYRLFEATENAIIAENRLSRVTLPELRKTGAYFLAWIPPGYATLTHPCPYGAIALLYPNQELSRYFIITARRGFHEPEMMATENIVAMNALVVIELHYAYHVPSAKGGTECNAFVRMWLQVGEQRTTPIQIWATKSGTQDPVWNSARALGPAAQDQFLVVELWAFDNGWKPKLVEAISVKSEDLFLNCMTPLYFITQGDECRMLIQPIPTPAATRKTVYFVRHGQSEWNKAQASMANPTSLVVMLANTDHPLAAAGVAQADDLSSKILKEMKESEKPGALSRLRRSLSGVEDAPPAISCNGFIATKLIVVSPLTRAVQTALIALQPILSTENRVIVLSPNVREKRNFGGRDSTGGAYDRNVEQKIRQSLHDVFPSKPERVSDLLSVVFDSSQVQGQWWTEKRESTAQVHERIDEMWNQIHYTSDRSVIVVGHSHYFREVFRHYVDETFIASNKELMDDLSNHVIMNCGVVGCTVDFGGSRRCIVDLRLLFNTKIVNGKKRNSTGGAVGKNAVNVDPEQDGEGDDLDA